VCERVSVCYAAATRAALTFIVALFDL
jgi:hypothetical protein